MYKLIVLYRCDSSFVTLYYGTVQATLEIWIHIIRAVRKSRIHDRRGYRDFRHDLRNGYPLAPKNIIPPAPETIEGIDEKKSIGI